MSTTTLSNGQTLDNATIVIGSTDLVLNNNNIYLTGTLTNAGTLFDDSTGNETGIILDSPTVTLLGGGILLLSDNANNRLFGNGAGTGALVNIDNTIAGAGQIGINAGGQAIALTNEVAGVIDATGVNNALVIQTGGPSLANDGLIEATGAAGLVVAQTTIDQTGGGTILASGGDVFLQGAADILGGVLRATLGSDILLNNGVATFGGLTTSAALTIAAATTVVVENNQGLDLYGTLDNLGTLFDDSVGNQTDIVLASPTVVLTGSGTVLFSDNTQNLLFGGGAGLGTLVNVDNTIAGAGDIGVNAGGQAITLINDAAGVIDGAGTVNALFIQTGGPTVVNAGLIEATGSGGLVIYNTVIDQTGGTVLADGAGDVFLQNGADIIGGVLRTTLGGEIFVNNGASTLGGPSAVAVLTIATSTTVRLNNNNELDLYGTIDDIGTLVEDAAGNQTNIVIAGPTVSLTGSGTLLLSDDANNRIYGAGSGLGTLINVDDTITGGGQIGVNAGGQALALTNDVAGVIDASAVNNALVIATGGPSLVNSGLIEATGAGSLVISNTVIDQTGGGTILANGALVQLQANAQILGGLLLATAGGEIVLDAGGTAYLGGPSTAAAITIGSATTVQVHNNQELDLYGTLDNLGTLAAASTGNITNIVLASPTVVLTGGGTVLFSDANSNRIFGAGSGLGTLINLDNTIAGGGQIGLNTSAQPIALTNATSGVIDASATNNALVIQTGGPTLVNDGLIEATGSGGLVIVNSVIDQTGGGTILASGAGDVNFQPNAEILGGLLRGVAGGEFFVDAGGTASLGGPSTAAAITIGTATTVQVDNNQQLDLYGTLDNLGTLAAASTGNITDIVFAGPTVMLTGGGTVLLSDNGNNRIYGGGSGLGTLINLDNTIAGAGQLGIRNGGLALSLTNHGVIDATGDNALVINTGGPAVINDALMEATGSGGLVIDSSVIDQTGGGTILATGSGNVYIQNNAEILGGLLLGTLGGEFFINTGGYETLGGPTTTAAITIGTATTVQVDNNQLLELYGTIVNLGTLADDSTGNGTDIEIEGPVVTLTGSGTLLLSDNANNRIYGGGSGLGGLLNLDNTIEGAGQIGINNDNLPLSLTNDAVIDADESDGTALVIDTGGPALINNALLEATNGGDLAIGNTTIANRFGTILAGGGAVNLNNADIIGGILIATGNGLFTDASGTTLDGGTTALTIAANTTFEEANNQYLYLAGTFENAGTLFDDAINNNTDIVLNSPTVVLTGSGTLLLSDSSNNRIYGGANSFATLINLNNTIEGAGQLGDNNGNYPLALTNDAVIDADESDGTALVIQTGGPALINNALLEATGSGHLTILNTTIDNGAGTILAGGGAVILNNADIIGGLLIATSGGLFTDVSNTTLDGGTTALTIAADTTFEEANNQYLYLAGTFENAGTLFDDATNNNTDIVLNSPTVVLTGSGTLLLSDSSNNRIYGGASSLATLINLNNTIEGAGQLGISSGNNPVTLINDGVIDANVSSASLQISTGGPSVVNAGLLEATDSAILSVNNTTITNAATGTIAAYDAGIVDVTGSSDVLNEVANTLTGGEYAAYAGGVLELLGSGPLAVDAANIILSGTGSEILFGNNTSFNYTTIESSLTEVSGTLQIDDGKTYSTSNILTVDAGGQLDLAAGTLVPAEVANAGTIFGYGVIADPSSDVFGNTILNTGEIEANGGTLIAASGYISGSGSIVIDSGAAFELGSIIGEPILREQVVFAPAVASAGSLVGDKLIIEGSPYGFQGVLTSLSPGDTIDLADATATSATITGTTLVISRADGAGTIYYSLSSADPRDRPVTSSDGAGGTDINIYGEAVAGTLQPVTKNFGDLHVGAAANEMLTLSNIATFANYAEDLDATMAAAGAGLTTGGSFNGLAPGDTNSTSLTAGLLTTTAGAKSGTATADLFTDGTSIVGDGLGPLAIGTESVSLSATVFNYATGSISPVPLSLGEHHVASSVTGFVTLANTAPGGIYSENLDAGLSGTSADLTALGTVSELAAGSLSSTALAVTLHSGAAGMQTGTVAISLVSDGAGIDTLGTTGLGTVVETVTGTLYNYATASSVTPDPVSLGQGHVTASLTKLLTISNAAAVGGFSEGLDVSLTGTSSDLLTAGSLTTLAAGAANSTALSVTLVNGTAGAFTGTSTIDLTSDGAGIDTLAATGLAAQTLTVTGTLFNEATASAIAPVDFGIVHVGAAASDSITIANSAASGLFSENLDASFTGATSLSAMGTLTALAAGAQNSTALTIALDTTAAGTIAGSATIGLVSDGAGIDTLGATSLGFETIAVTGTVDNYATAAIATVSGAAALTGGGTSYELNFGNIGVGTTHAESLQILNDAAGPADLLGGSFAVFNAAPDFDNLGFTGFTSIAAGGADTGLTIALGGTTLGQFSETIVLSPTGFNASGYSGTLALETLFVTGDIMPCFAAGTRILGLAGEIPVESVRPGDILVTVREHGPATRRVLWVGQRSLDLTRHPQPAEVQPIRILAGAFAIDMPARDLLVSPRHALYVDGALFEAVSLINNVSIYQETVSHITYHHVELESHDVLLAEGLPAESFFDNGNKSMFAHQAGPIALHPLFPATGAAGLCAPVITGGDRLTALRDRLASRLPATTRRAAA